MVERVLVVPEQQLLRRVKDRRVDAVAERQPRVLAILVKQIGADGVRETPEVARGIEFEIAEENGAVANELFLEHLAVAFGPQGEVEILRVRLQDQRQRCAAREAARDD